MPIGNFVENWAILIILFAQFRLGKMVHDRRQGRCWPSWITWIGMPVAAMSIEAKGNPRLMRWVTQHDGRPVRRAP